MTSLDVSFESLWTVSSRDILQSVLQWDPARVVRILPRSLIKKSEIIDLTDKVSAVLMTPRKLFKNTIAMLFLIPSQILNDV
jgi:hypothetical protein